MATASEELALAGGGAAVKELCLDINHLPLAAPARVAAKNALLRGGPRDGLRVWHAVPHALLMSFDGMVYIWRYTQETEPTADGELAVYAYGPPLP